MEFPKEDYAALVSTFLDDMNFQRSSQDISLEVEQDTVNYFEKQPWDVEIRESVIRTAKGPKGNQITLLYPHASHKTKFRISVINAYLILFDDVNFSNAFSNFATNLVKGKSQDHPVLNSFVSFLSDDTYRTSAFVDSLLLQDIIKFSVGCDIERQIIGVPPTGGKCYPEYVRDMSGVGEVYAIFVFCDLVPESYYKKLFVLALQDTTHYLVHVNDILYFYKESIDGEEVNFIRDFASAKGISIYEAPRLTCSKSIENIENIRSIFSGHEELLNIMDGFFNGFIEFHLRADRYRLNEIPSLRKYYPVN